jgi:hypothetical protein
LIVQLHLPFCGVLVLERSFDFFSNDRLSHEFPDSDVFVEQMRDSDVSDHWPDDEFAGESCGNGFASSI